MQCKQCGNELGANATYCPCGWRKNAHHQPQQRPDVPCAHTECGIAAMCKIQTPTGWANLCWIHYDQHYAQQAKANCDAKGLHTTEQLRAAFKAQVASLAGRLSNREFLKQREPGEDWAEQPAT